MPDPRNKIQTYKLSKDLSFKYYSNDKSSNNLSRYFMEIEKILSIASISLLAAMSPGPDFAIVVRNCLTYKTFKAGLLTALGVASSVLVHVSYCVFGLAILI